MRSKREKIGPIVTNCTSDRTVENLSITIGILILDLSVIQEAQSCPVVELSKNFSDN